MHNWVRALPTVTASVLRGVGSDSLVSCGRLSMLWRLSRDGPRLLGGLSYQLTPPRLWEPRADPPRASCLSCSLLGVLRRRPFLHRRHTEVAWDVDLLKH
jgi:hypothetical protein